MVGSSLQEETSKESYGTKQLVFSWLAVICERKSAKKVMVPIIFLMDGSNVQEETSKASYGTKQLVFSRLPVVYKRKPAKEVICWFAACTLQLSSGKQIARFLKPHSCNSKTLLIS